MKNQLFKTVRMLIQDKITDKYLRWKYLKYKIRKFTIKFSKNLVKEENKYQNFLENDLKKTYLSFKQISTNSNVNKNLKKYIPKK